MVDGGKVGLDVVPDFSGFGGLFSQGIRGALSQALSIGNQIGNTLGGGIQQGAEKGTEGAQVTIGDFVGTSVRNFTLLGAGVALAIGEFVRKGVQEYQRLGSETLELQHVTGASAKEASLFAGVIDHLGGSVGSVTKGLGVFGSHIAGQPELFQKYGVAIAFARDGQQDLLGTLENLRQKFQADGNVTERNAAAKALLGKSYQQLLPYLNLTNEQLAIFQRLTRESGGVLDEADVERSRELAIQLRVVGDRVESVKRAAGRKAAGFLSEFFTGLDVVSHESGPLAKARDIIGGLFGRDWSSAAARGAAADIAAVGTAAAAATIQVENLAKAEDSIGKAAQGVRSAQRGLADAQEGVVQAQRGVERAEQGVANAHHATQAAVRSRSDAQSSLNQLLQKGAVDADAVAQAERGVASANRSVRDATESLASATQKLRDIQQGASADELTDAHLRLADATLSLAEARRQAATTRPTTDDPFASQRARLSVRQAVQSRKRAQEELNTTLQKGTSADKELTDAQRQVRDASERLSDAMTAQTEAQKRLSEAQAGDPDFQHKVAQAKQAVADASYAVQQAEQGEVDAKQGVVDARDQVRKAEDAVQEATYKVRDAQVALNDAWDVAHGNGVGLIQVVDALIAKYPELQGVLAALTAQQDAAAQQVLAKFQAMPPEVQARSDPATYDAYLLLHPEKRARGGRVYPGQAYWVGEEGPEPFVPDRPGTIIPAGTPMGGDGASAPVSISVTANITAQGLDLTSPRDRQAIADQLARETHGALTRYRKKKAGQTS